MLFAKLTSKELAEEVFGAIKYNNSCTSIATIYAEITGKLVRRLHLYPLPEKGILNTTFSVTCS